MILKYLIDDILIFQILIDIILKTLHKTLEILWLIPDIFGQVVSLQYII